MVVKRKKACSCCKAKILEKTVKIACSYCSFRYRSFLFFSKKNCARSTAERKENEGERQAGSCQEEEVANREKWRGDA